MSEPRGDESSENPIDAGAQAKLVVGIVFLAFMGQMLLNPIIAPLSRQMGLEEWHIGATISLAAIVLAAASSYWGRASQRLGAKRVLASGLVIAIVALSSFGVIACLGMNRTLSGLGVVFGVVITRGLVYGAGISAIAPTVQAHLVTHTASENGRVKALGMIGAAQGVASIIGGIAGGTLAAVGGLLLPLLVMPIVMVAGLIILLAAFKPQGHGRLSEEPKRIRFTDPRVAPWLVSGLIIFLVFSSIATIFGFTIQDRFALSATETAGVSAIYLTVMGVAMIITQAVIAPKTRWRATKLLRTGFVIILAATPLIWPSSSHALLAAGCVLLGMGMGLALPGYNAGPTLKMSVEEQGAVAGVINANNGLAYAIAPLASTALYGWNPLAPFIISIILTAAITVFVFLHPVLRR
ncbi:MAG: MFS transporter [Schaalia hyovaginalis]|uniref:MFS transporter n=1 Tax=Schaalia hyovaginalis TaxID=29316 RepID=UPI0026F2B4C4|nr:MFS transporter [Schaalia hyovaginalis]MCI6556250.1 MFS transporter [Schaalia hyovaginalis]MDD7554979.1 MFS transporter [Schaalia hyovaginalis]MDY3093620.1 MFS transporter [Schaalia hyovaginalis]MDY6213778.1 MFS transporter [Schaalia hyovaginalis]